MTVMPLVPADTMATARIAEKAANKAMEAINAAIMKKNKGQLDLQMIEMALILLVAKYWKTRAEQAGDLADIREECEDFRDFLDAVLADTFGEPTALIQPD